MKHPMVYLVELHFIWFNKYIYAQKTINVGNDESQMTSKSKLIRPTLHSEI